MAEKVQKLSVRRDRAFMYYVYDAAIWRVARKSPGVPKGRPERIAQGTFEMDTNFIYFVDSDGDVARASRAVIREDDQHNEEDDDESSGDGAEVEELLGKQPADSKELLYTLFPELEVPEATQNIRVIQDEAARLFSEVSRLDDLDALTPRQLEQLLAEVFHRDGYESYLTPPARDGGRDVIAVLPGPLPYLVVAEAKKMRYVKPTVVQALWGVRDRDKAHVGLLATTGRFSDGTRHMVQKTWGRLLSLRDGEEFIEWIGRIKRGSRPTQR